ncbi:hypothetical protein BGZ63DRAFT_398973 [Mariannaea sp. PMI_226]|nr:hypothetical protein BGZ63DRAFT_398973 [Mariannaea sp. PMI_226]
MTLQSTRELLDNTSVKQFYANMLPSNPEGRRKQAGLPRGKPHQRFWASGFPPVPQYENNTGRERLNWTPRTVSAVGLFSLHVAQFTMYFPGTVTLEKEDLSSCLDTNIRHPWHWRGGSRFTLRLGLNPQVEQTPVRVLGQPPLPQHERCDPKYVNHWGGIPLHKISIAEPVVHTTPPLMFGLSGVRLGDGMDNLGSLSNMHVLAKLGRGRPHGDDAHDGWSKPPHRTEIVWRATGLVEMHVLKEPEPYSYTLPL